jgi:hypothetical protein
MTLEGLRSDVLERRYRANGDFELVVVDRLSSAELKALGNEAFSLYGVLRPRVRGLKTKAVTHDVALLFFTLIEAATIPKYAQVMMGRSASATIARLVLDEILAIETEQGFVTGTRARGQLFAAESAANEATDRIAKLSLQGLQYASRLTLAPDELMWMRLYFYNRLPLSPRWARLFPNANELSAILAGGPKSETRRRLAECFRSVPPHPENDRWRLFDHLLPRARIESDNLRYKLYVSPHPSKIVEAFAAVVAAVAEVGAPRFKIGSDVYGLLRSDKIIIYTPERSMIDALAERIAGELKGVEAHGVPFTAALSEDGLLSWGVDPAPAAKISGWTSSTDRSWRVFVAKALASTLERQRRDEPSHPEPWAFALDRLRFDGVDPVTWTPHEALFRAGGDG